MAVDTPATIAIIGAGPIGLEAALYGRYLGYEVLLFDRGPVAAEVLRWGIAAMDAPFGQCASPLGLAALHAQDPNWKPPARDAILTGRAWREAYLSPLAHSDLLVDGLFEYSEVVAVVQSGESGEDQADEDEDGDDEGSDDEDGDTGSLFCVTIRKTNEASKSKRQYTVDVVIDASGVDGRPLFISGSDAASSTSALAAGLPTRSAIEGIPATARPLTDEERSAVLAAYSSDGQPAPQLDPQALELMTSEPDFYFLGSRICGPAKAPFTIAAGLDQIRALYTILGDRPALDLYATMAKLLP